MSQQRQRHVTPHITVSSGSADDDDRPRSILKPAPSGDVAVRSSRPTFAQGRSTRFCGFVVLVFVLWLPLLNAEINLVYASLMFSEKCDVGL